MQYNEEIDDTMFDLLDSIHKDINNKDDKNGANCTNCNTNVHFVEIFSEGIVVCTKCGAVQSEILDETAEWRNFEDSNKGSANRCTKISYGGYSNSVGTSIACSYNSRLSVMHKWSIAQYKEKTLNEVLDLIRDKCRAGSILKCIEDDAKILYKNIYDIKFNQKTQTNMKVITRGKNRRGLIAACIFYACKRKECTRSPKEIAILFGLKDTEITKGCKTFIKLKNKINIQCNLNPSAPEHFIARFCKKLNMHHYIDDITQLVKNIQRLNIASVHTPLSIATASILLISNYYNLGVTKRIIATKFMISDVTIQKAYSEIYIYKNILLDNERTNKIVTIADNVKKFSKVPSHLKYRYEQVTGQTIDDVVDGPIEYSIDSVDLIDKLNRLTYLLHEQIYNTNVVYYNLINNMQMK